MVSMKILLVLLALLAVVFSSTLAAAADVNANSKVVQISSISAYPTGSDVLVSVNLKADQKITDASLVVSVPDLNIRVSRRLDFSKDKRHTVHLEIPVPAEFDPYLQIAFDSQEGRRVKYRQVVLQ